MIRHDVRTPEQAVAYLVDCTLATVCDLALKKSRSKYDFMRQVDIAQRGIDWMRQMKISPATTRAEEIMDAGITVAEWAKQFMPA